MNICEEVTMLEGDQSGSQSSSKQGFKQLGITPENQQIFEDVQVENDEDIDTYYFESDHLALKGNPDYQALLKSIVLLEAQRIQAIKDIDKLHTCKEGALKDPIKFVEKLQQGADLGLPKPQNVVSLPDIHWEKYTSSVDFSQLGLPKHVTRLKRNLIEGSDSDQKVPIPMTTDEKQVTLVRGRVKDESKSTTFNKLWTVEEQQRLEKLLIQYPPEEVEARRWQKIATALGNRTSQQVASRVQKYFIKLAKAGLPIPGRLPNMATYQKKAAHRHQRFLKFYHQPSTFLHSYEPPVYMSDDESQDNTEYDFSMDQESQSSFQDDMSADVSDDETVPAHLRDSEAYQELMKLKRIKQERLQDKKHDKHVGFKCDSCECEPIIGTRWHCTDCPKDDEVDFCDNCVDCYYETGKHNSSHRLVPIRRAQTSNVADKDYLTFMPGDYNYLDPNYMPAS